MGLYDLEVVSIQGHYFWTDRLAYDKVLKKYNLLQKLFALRVWTMIFDTFKNSIDSSYLRLSNVTWSMKISPVIIEIQVCDNL